MQLHLTAAHPSMDPDILVRQRIAYLPGLKDDDIGSYYGVKKKEIYDEEDSEKSYPSLIPADDMEDYFTFLSFGILWMCLTAVSIIGLFTISTSREVFSSEIFNISAALFAYVIFTVFNIVDIISSTLHFIRRKTRKKRIYAPKSVVLFVMDILSLITIPMDLKLYFVPGSKSDRVENQIIIGFTLFRLHRVRQFLYTLTSSPLRQGLRFVVMKYTLLMMLMAHAGACIWRLLGCFECRDDRIIYWTDSYSGSKNNTLELYGECLFRSFSAITNTGLVPASKRNDSENLVLVMFMFFSLFVNNGVFLGAFTSILEDGNKRRSLFGTQFNMLKQQLQYRGVSSSLKKIIIKWYYNFWVKESAIHECPILYELPGSIIKDIQTDKYWCALTQSRLLREAPNGLKRAIATEMSTFYYNRGDIIVHQDQFVGKLFYVASGLVHVVAPDDIESPIVTLSIGTCICDFTLILYTPSPVNIIAATYCKIHLLEKRKLWTTMVKYSKLNYSKRMREIVEYVIGRAKQRSSLDALGKKSTVKTLKLVKEKLQTKLNTDFISTRKITPGQEKYDLMDKYIISKTVVSRHKDVIFVKTTWPWILYPKSQLIYIWQSIIVGFSLAVIIIYPYVLFYRVNIPAYYHNFLRPVAYMLYSADLALQVFTSIHDEQQVLVVAIHEIIAKKFTHFFFLIDLISIIPCEIFFGSITWSKYFHCNHMLKLTRVVTYSHDLSKSFRFGTSLTKIILYVLYLLYLGYILGLLYFVVACPERPCKLDTWVGEYKRYVNNDIDLQTDNDNGILFVSMLYGMIIISGTGGNFFLATGIEKAMLSVSLCFFVLLYTYLLADYSATLTLSQMVSVEFIAESTTMKRFLMANKVKRQIINRFGEYEETLWEQTHGIKLSKLMADIPLNCFEKLSVDKYSYLLTSVPLFHRFDSMMLKKIGGKCVNELFPPDEHIVYSGIKCSEMYIIEKGYCELKSPGNIKVIGPMSSFCVIDMLLGVPVLHNVRTLTNVSTLRISMDDINTVLSHQTTLKDKLEALVARTKITMTATRLFAKNDDCLNLMNVKKEYHASFFHFPGVKLHPLNLDYRKGWSGFNLIRHILRRTTILPNGKFLYMYVICYSCVAFLSAMINPCLFIYATLFPNYVVMLLSLPLDFLCLVDIYIRMHVCFYNKDGILVTHPRYTAIHYMTTSFAVDLITSLPLHHTLLTFLPSKQMCFLVLLVKVMKGYRIPNAFAYCERERLKTEGILINVLKFVILTMVILNAMAATMLLIGTEYSVNRDGYTVLTPTKKSWIYSKKNSEYAIGVGEYAQPGKMYLLSIYFICTIAMQLGIGDIDVTTPAEEFYIIFVLVTGFLWFTYILVYISNTQALLNERLTQHQNHMKDLIQFMKQFEIPKAVINKCVRHFEYLWQRTQGLEASEEIFKNYNLTLKNDCILNLCYETLSSVQLFEHVDVAFYSQVGSKIKISYYLQDYDIVRIHNIVDSLYIVHRGKVQVIGPTGNVMATLRKGAIFGNLDNIPCSRSMITTRSKNTVDIMTINTTLFYEILASYPAVQKLLEVYLLGKNSAYVNVRTKIWSEDVDLAMEYEKLRTKLALYEKMLMSRKMELMYMMFAFISYIMVIYMAMLQDHTIWVIGINYVLDGLHILKIYLKFITPFISSMGEIVTNRKQIQKRYLRTLGFYFDLFALIPTEVISLLFAKDLKNIFMYISWLRLNRVLRLFNIRDFLSVTDDYLNVNVMAIKLFSIIVHFIIFVHTSTCIWYVLACPNTKCMIESWAYDTVNNLSACYTHYICSLYFTTSMLTFTGFSTMWPRSYIDVVGTLISLPIYKFLVSIFISTMAAIVRHYAHRLGVFSLKLNIFKSYLNNGQISYMLHQKVMKYLDKLWYLSKGRQMPVFVDYGQESLTEEIKVFSFGSHIFNNVIFNGCHGDFIRQLTCKTKMVTFFGGDYICRQGDIDETMYFIHAGFVDVILVGMKEETLIDKLKAPDCFGMIQGLFPNTPHSHSYKAKAVTQVVTLNLRDWMHLLAFFPASKFNIYNMLFGSDGMYMAESK